MRPFNFERANQQPTVAVLGHFAFDTSRIDGQIYRTRLVFWELQKRLSESRVIAVDTGFITSRLLKTIIQLWYTLSHCKDIIIMPGVRGLRWLLPLYLYWKKIYGFRLHYLVVGGWLPKYLGNRPVDVKRLSSCENIFVQSRRMVTELRKLSLSQVDLLPNFRDFSLDRNTSQSLSTPLRVVFLSRIIRDKGVALAMQAVEEMNAKADSALLTLDIWGPIQKGEGAWFSNVLKRFNLHIRYKGVLNPNDIPAILSSYDVMVFPTWYSGEGFPGAVIDALIAGLPVIASDWQDNCEFIEDGVTGLIFRTRDLMHLKEKLLWAVCHPDEIKRMKLSAAAAAEQYHVDHVIPPLLKKMGLTAPEE